MSNKIVIDLDGTLAIIDPNCAYADLLPDKDEKIFYVIFFLNLH
jgi:hypothetical protein